MKILILTTSFPRFTGDDAGIFVERLVNGLVRADSQITVEVIVPLDKQEPLLEQISDRILVRRFQYGFFTKGALAFGAGIVPNLKANPILFFQIPGLILGFVFCALRSQKFDIIHAQWLISAIPACLIKFIRSAKVVVTARGEDLRLLSNQYARFILKPFLRSADCITAVSSSAADLSSKWLAKRPTVVENGVELQYPSRQQIEEISLQYSITEKSLLFVGSVIPRKRIELLLEILRALPDYKLFIAGRIDDRDYLTRLQDAAFELLPRVSFLGQISPNNIPALMVACRRYSTASEFEGRSNSLLEASALGVYVFASDIPSHRELIKDRTKGAIFGSVNEAVEQITKLESDLPTKSRAQFSSWTDSASQYIQTYRQVLGQ